MIYLGDLYLNISSRFELLLACVMGVGLWIMHGEFDYTMEGLSYLFLDPAVAYLIAMNDYGSP